MKRVNFGCKNVLFTKFSRTAATICRNLNIRNPYLIFVTGATGIPV